MFMGKHALKLLKIYRSRIIQSFKIEIFLLIKQVRSFIIYSYAK